MSGRQNSTPPKTTETPLYDTAPRPLGDIHAVERSLNICRSTLEKLLRTDPAFPAPMMIAGKRQWFMDEIEDYKQAQPRRQYAESAA